jgi:diacylglycerol kinase family enzyme
MQDKVTLSFKNTKIKVDERSKNRMKITVKLAKEEAEAFKSFMTIKPDNLPDEQFFKHIFFTGCKTLNEELKALFDAKKDELLKQRDAAQSPQTDPLDDDAS